MQSMTPCLIYVYIVLLAGITLLVSTFGLQAAADQNILIQQQFCASWNHVMETTPHKSKDNY